MSNTTDKPVAEGFCYLNRKKQVHEEMASNEERIRLLIKTYAQSFWEADTNGIIKTVTSNWRGKIDRAEMPLLRNLTGKYA